MADQSRRPPSHAELMEPSIPDELTCTICLSLLCEPVFWPSATTSSCHHSFCRLCAFKVLRVSQNPTCPLCREPAANLSQLEAGDLNLDDGPKYRQVLKAFPIPGGKLRCHCTWLAITRCARAKGHDHRAAYRAGRLRSVEPVQPKRIAA